MYSYCVDFNLKNSLFYTQKSCQKCRTKSYNFGHNFIKKIAKKTLEIKIKILLIFAKKIGFFLNFFALKITIFL